MIKILKLILLIIIILMIMRIYIDKNPNMIYGCDKYMLSFERCYCAGIFDYNLSDKDFKKKIKEIRLNVKNKLDSDKNITKYYNKNKKITYIYHIHKSY